MLLTKCLNQAASRGRYLSLTANQRRNFLEIPHKLFSLLFARLRVGCAQNRRRVNCSHYMGREITFRESATISRDTKIFAQQRLRRACAQANQNLRSYNLQFRVKPGAACFNFRMARLLVNAALAALRGYPLEMLHYICDVDIRAIDSYFGKHLIQQPSGGSNERMTGSVFTIARLLSYEHHPGSGWTFSKYRLGAELPKIAGFAGLGGLLQRRECR